MHPALQRVPFTASMASQSVLRARWLGRALALAVPVAVAASPEWPARWYTTRVAECEASTAPVAPIAKKVGCDRAYRVVSRGRGGGLKVTRATFPLA